MRYALSVAALAFLLTGCSAVFGVFELTRGLEWSERATASKCAEGQDLKEVWGVWQCVDH